MAIGLVPDVREWPDISRTNHSGELACLQWGRCKRRQSGLRIEGSLAWIWDDWWWQVMLEIRFFMPSNTHPKPIKARSQIGRVNRIMRFTIILSHNTLLNICFDFFSPQQPASPSVQAINRMMCTLYVYYYNCSGAEKCIKSSEVVQCPKKKSGQNCENCTPGIEYNAGGYQRVETYAEGLCPQQEHRERGRWWHSITAPENVSDSEYLLTNTVSKYRMTLKDS